MIVLFLALAASGAALAVVLAVIARSGSDLLDEEWDCPDFVEAV